jgi:hypothetical protein
VSNQRSYAAFAAERLVHRGPLVDVLAAIKLGHSDDRGAPLLIFENETGRQVDFDLRGSLDDVLERVKTREAPKGPGRPRLGVESREVTLLPRHWAWLALQPSGASAALRRLIDDASKRVDPEEGSRGRRDAAYRVMSVLAGNRVGFEEAARALFAGDHGRFHALAAEWPDDIRAHLSWLIGSPPEGIPS